MSRNPIARKYGTDIDRLRDMKDEDIDYSDIPKTTPEFWAKAVVRKGLKPVVRKKQVTLRIDSDVLDFLRSEGDGYQTKINQLLRSYVDESKAAQSR